MRMLSALAVQTARGIGKAKNSMFRHWADLPPISQYLDQRSIDDVVAFFPHLPDLCAADRTIVEQLRSNGFAITTTTAFNLCGHQELVRDGSHVGAEFSTIARQQAKIGVQHNAVSGDVIVAHPHLYLWGLDERLLDIAEVYLQRSAAYEGGLVSYTVADGDQQGPRRWHVDHEDRQMIKVIIYCNDVGPEDGPFELVTDLAEARPETVTITGPAGTMIFADTARLQHRGRPATASDRIALFAHYFPRRPRYRLGFPKASVTNAQIREMVSGLSRRLRAAALWRLRSKLA